MNYPSPKEVYLAGVEEARETFKNVYHEEITPYTELCWGLSRVIGTDPKDHVPSSRWHNALCTVHPNEVDDYDKWTKAVLDLHIGHLQNAIGKAPTRRYSYGADHHVERARNRGIDEETKEFIDREIKRAYPKVRRNTKKYRELAESVQSKARHIMAGRIIYRAENELNVVENQNLKNAEQEADLLRGTAYKLEESSALVLKLRPEAEEQIAAETRKMLDALIEAAAAIVKPWQNAKQEIEALITEMKKELTEEVPQ